MARAAVTANGVVAAAIFSPFGKTLSDTPLAVAAEAISYSGEVHDPYTGLDIYQYRSYNPRLGRWMSPDPSGLRFADLTNPQSFNLYAFVMNDPLKYFDAHGLFAVDGDDEGDGPVGVDGGDTTVQPLADEGGGGSPGGDGGGGTDGGEDGTDPQNPYIPPVTPVDLSCDNGCGTPPSVPPPVDVPPVTCPDCTSSPGDPTGVDPGDPSSGDPSSGYPGDGDPGSDGSDPSDPGSPTHGPSDPCASGCSNPGPSQPTLPIGAGILIEAAKANGSNYWAISNSFFDNSEYFRAGSDKCNDFVFDMVLNAGVRAVVTATGRIPTAAQFADPTVAINGLSAPAPLSEAQPGDVIAQFHGYSRTSGNAEGHVGIVMALPQNGQPGQTASANRNVGGRVTVNDWGFRSPTADPNNGERNGAASPPPVVRHPL